MAPAGRFEQGELLGQRPGVCTRRGVDRRSGAEVVVKEISRGLLGEASRARLVRDAAVLLDLTELEPAPLLAWEEEDGLLRLVSPYAPGATLAARIAAGALPVEEAVAVARQVVEALTVAHARGVLHRNIKPTNVVLARPGAARLVDFALSPADLLGPAARDLPVEAIRHLSPEQAGLLRQSVDERSDLHSVGLLLFECLAGRPHYEGREVGELLRQQLNMPPISLRELGVDVPRELEQLVKRLLQKEPGDRYQTAAAVRGDLRAIARGLRREGSGLVIGRSDHRRVLTGPVFIGREEELQRLEQALVRARLGEGGVALLEGEAGAGKSSVLDELARRAAVRGCWVLRGEAADQPGRPPFQLLDRVVRDVVRRMASDAGLKQRLRERLGDLLPVLVQALPALAEPLGSKGDGDALEEARKRRTQRALGRFLTLLGTRERPALVLLDDCQWADDALLRGLSASAGEVHTLVVLAHCPDELQAGHALRRGLELPRVVLTPLPDAQVGELLESMAGALPPAAVALVTRLSGGNPAMAAALLWGLVETDSLVPVEKGWELAQRDLAEVQSSRRVGVMLARRLGQLPRQVLHVLRAGAVLGRSFETAEAAAAGELPEGVAVELLSEARRRHLLWLDPDGRRWHFAHRLLQEQVLETLEDPAELHLRAARYLERRSDERAPYQVAYHLDAAGRTKEALSYALEAAEDARQRYALEVAEHHYRIAARGAARADRATRRQVALGLGEVLLARNRHDEAREQLHLALTLCDEEVTRARIYAQLGRLAYRRGENRLAGETLEEGLRAVGHPAPREGWPTIGRLALELGRHVLGRQPRSGGDTEGLAVGLHTHLPIVWWHYRGLIPALWSHYFRLNRAGRRPGSPELGYAYAFQARLLGSLSLFERADRYIELSQEICDRLEDPWGQGHILFMQALVFYASARFEEAQAKLEPAIALLEQAGDPWQALAAEGILGTVHLRKGDLRRAEALGRRLHEEGVRRDQALPASAGLDIWSKATGGRIPGALTRAERFRAGDDVIRRAFVAQAEAVRLLREGELRQAATVLEQTWEETGRARVRREHVFPVPGWMLTALRLWAVHDSGRRQALLARAGRMAGRARLLARRFPNHRPHVLRECGLLAGAARDVDRALRYLDESVEVSRQQGARYELGQSLLARARLRGSVGLPGAGEDDTEASRLLAECGADFALGETYETRASPDNAHAATFSLADRLDQLLGVGHRIVTSLSREAVFEATREAATNLIRGQNSLIIEAVDDGGGFSPQVVSGDGEAVVSSTLVEQAMTQGTPLTTASGVPEGISPASESIMLSNVRSVLVAPFARQRDRRYCLYVTHGQVGGLFGEEERRLAAFITSLAGAALENAESYRRLEVAFEALDRAHGELKSTQAQLVQAAKLAALGQLGAGIAHELNQPIQSIQGFAQRILRHGEAPVSRHQDELEIIVNATHRMAHIVQNIRMFAREGEPRRQPIDPLQPMRQALELLQRQLGELGVQVEWQVRPLPSVLGDPVQLQQVFLNLIMNARDALVTLPEGVARALTLSGTAERDRVTLAVADSGPGVPGELSGRIFDPFFTTKGPGEGVGLGLSISYGIIKDHGGELLCEPAASGARFSVVLPVAER